MSKQNRFTLAEKMLATIFIGGLIVTMINAFTQGLDSPTTYNLMPLLIVAPFLWLIHRGEKSGDRDGTYPLKSDDPDEPITELGVFGHSRTFEYSVMPKDPENWLNPDVETFIGLQKKRKKAALKKMKGKREDTFEEKKEKSKRRRRMVR